MGKATNATRRAPPSLYLELVALLRSQWRPDLSWEAIVELRGQLQGNLEQLRARRGILPAVIYGPCCGTTAPAASPLISVRAMLLAVGPGIGRPSSESARTGTQGQP
jgi:hypothetical protein